MPEHSAPWARRWFKDADPVCLASDRALWLQERRKGIGSSEAAVIVLGRQFQRTPMSIWLDKTGIEEPADLSGEEWVQLGQELEPFVSRRWEKETGRCAEPCGALYRNRERPWMQATPDFLWANLIAGKHPRAVGPLETKTTGNLGRWDDGVPEHIRIQCQHQMAVTGLPKASVAVLGGGPVMGFRWADLERDQAFIDEVLLPAVDAFWLLVTSREPPEVDDTRETAAALAKLYALGGDATVALPADFLDVFDDLEEAKALKKKAEARERLLSSTVKAALKNAEIGVLPSGDTFSWKLQHRKAYTKVVDAADFRVLRMKRRKP